MKVGGKMGNSTCIQIMTFDDHLIAQQNSEYQIIYYESQPGG